MMNSDLCLPNIDGLVKSKTVYNYKKWGHQVMQ